MKLAVEYLIDAGFAFIDWFLSIGIYLLLLLSIGTGVVYCVYNVLNTQYVTTTKVSREDARLCAPAAARYQECLRTLGYEYKFIRKETTK